MIGTGIILQGSTPIVPILDLGAEIGCGAEIGNETQTEVVCEVKRGETGRGGTSQEVIVGATLGVRIGLRQRAGEIHSPIPVPVALKGLCLPQRKENAPVPGARALLKSPHLILIPRGAHLR